MTGQYPSGLWRRRDWREKNPTSSEIKLRAVPKDRSKDVNSMPQTPCECSCSPAATLAPFKDTTKATRDAEIPSATHGQALVHRSWSTGKWLTGARRRESIAARQNPSL